MTVGCFQPRPAAASASCVHNPKPSKALMAASRSCSVSASCGRAFMLLLMLLRCRLLLVCCSWCCCCWCCLEGEGESVQCFVLNDDNHMIFRLCFTVLCGGFVVDQLKFRPPTPQHSMIASITFKTFPLALVVQRGSPAPNFSYPPQAKAK